MSAGSSERSASSSSSIDPVSKYSTIFDAMASPTRSISATASSPPGEVLDRRGVFADVLRGAAVGGRFVLDACRFEQVGELLEEGGDLVVTAHCVTVRLAGTNK